MLRTTRRCSRLSSQARTGPSCPARPRPLTTLPHPHTTLGATKQVICVGACGDQGAVCCTALARSLLHPPRTHKHRASSSSCGHAPPPGLPLWTHATPCRRDARGGSRFLVVDLRPRARERRGGRRGGRRGHSANCGIATHDGATGQLTASILHTMCTTVHTRLPWYDSSALVNEYGRAHAMDSERETIPKHRPACC